MLILARCSGSVTVSSVRTLRNLLGKSCEWFEPSPRVTAAHDGGFLSLEVNVRVGVCGGIKAQDAFLNHRMMCEMDVSILCASHTVDY